jgi:hypothetical protein
MICQDCSSTEFRISRFRWSDLERLALLQYPVRCRKCHKRTYAGLPLALVLLQARRAKRSKRAQSESQSH